MRKELEEIIKKIDRLETTIIKTTPKVGLDDILISYMYSYCKDFPLHKESVKDLAEYIVDKATISVLSEKLSWLILEIS